MPSALQYGNGYVRQFLGYSIYQRNDWIVVIKAFFDESWNPNRPRMFAVAGILATAHQWNDIENGWKAALAKQNAEMLRQGRKQLSRYHAAEMNARSSEFDGWSKEESLQFTESLLSVIRGRKMFIISSAIVLDDMVKVFPEWAVNTQGYAYGYAFLQCLQVCGRIAANPKFVEPGHMLKAWHDQCQWSDYALDAFQKVQADPTYSENWRFGALSHDSSEDNVCLQPADMMAYECWRESERYVLDSNARPDMRPFFSRLVGIEEHRVYATYSGERFFREHRDLLEKNMAAKNAS